MIGQRVQHYQITEKLGEGGMGVVYKAEDTKLKRTVALKFLSTELTDDQEEQLRLKAEARAAAAVNHPNICTIYEINEHKGRTFIAMEFVEGATLRDRVLSGRIEFADALRYLIQIASGLKATHDVGIIHRDMKSANIMINSAGQAVIMDFGLARRSGQAQGEAKVSSRGTSAYMSPEQARGDGVDERTDIWSLGVVLYEMVSGHLPFRGDYEQAIIYSILNEPHRPVSELRDGVPQDIAAIMDRCLAKAPESRYQTIDELTKAIQGSLDRLTGRTGAARPARSGVRALMTPVVVVAVLIVVFLAYDFLRVDEADGDVRVPIAVADFANESGEPSLDGLSGMLITALEQSARLSVVTRSRMFDILKTLDRGDVARIDESTGQDICLAEGIDALVIPSIRKFGDLYTIDLKVLDTRNNRYVFTVKKEGQGMESVPRMIDQIARDIRIDLVDSPEAIGTAPSVAQVTTNHLDAYQAYFDGEEHVGRLEFKEAATSFARAVEIDSSFALAHYRLAYVSWWTRQSGAEAKEHVELALRDLDRIPEKERYLVRALKAGIVDGFDAQLPILREMYVRYPDDKEMLFGIGDASFHVDEWDSARVYFEKALAIDPEFERALQHLTWTYLITEKFEEARAMASRWVRTSGSAESYQSLARAQFLTGDGDAAMATVELAREKDPESKISQAWVAEMYLARGEMDEAIALLGAEMADSTNALKIREAGRVLVTAIYPYQGRYREALATVDAGIDMLAGANGDSTGLAGAMLGKAFLYYWGYQDTDAMMKTVAAAMELPENTKKYGYWPALAAAHYVVGDTTMGNEILRTKVEHLSEPERVTFEILALAQTGQCDAARVVLANEKQLLAGGGKNLREQAQFVVGACQYRHGDFTGVIDNLETLAFPEATTFQNAGFVVPASFMLGRAYEERARVADAVRCYERITELWKNADEDLPILIGAKARLAHIVATGSL